MCDDEQRLEVLEKISPSLTTISLNTHGTRTVQKVRLQRFPPAQPFAISD
jgi:hypothetical protein